MHIQCSVLYQCCPSVTAAWSLQSIIDIDQQALNMCELHTLNALINYSATTAVVARLTLLQLASCSAKSCRPATACLLCLAHQISFCPVWRCNMWWLQSEGNTFREAYGRIMGTQLVCCWLAVLLSFMPPRALRRCFPPLVTGTTIFLIGAGLIGTGLTVQTPSRTDLSRQEQTNHVSNRSNNS